MSAAPRPAGGGRDPRAQLIAPPPGRPRACGPGPSAAVVGGGVAGLAAATALAERGVRVTLYEREEVLGGRVAGWPVTLADGSRVTMSRGFHAFFRQYYNLRALLRRADPGLRQLTALPDYPLWHATGARESFARVPRTPPWNALGYLALSPACRPRELLRMRPAAALPLLDVRVPEVYRRFDAVSAREFLDAIRFPAAARQAALEVFSRSFFADPGELSAAEMVLMFHVYFLGSSEGLLFDVPREPFPAALWEPLARHLAGLGAEIRAGTAVRRVEPLPDGGFEVLAASGVTGAHRHDAVVLALDTAGLRELVGHSPGLPGPDWRARIAALRTAPPFLVSRLWLDRPVAAGRPGFLATGGFGPLDNVSVLDRWEGEAARWAARTGGSVVELHAYALPRGADPAAQQRRLHAELARVYPEARAARVVDARHLWRADCPLFARGGHAERPGVRTPHPRLLLAGDLVRTGLPVALMERAATSGFLAANALLAGWGLAGHPLWTVPRRGRFALLRALARLGASAAPGATGSSGSPGASAHRRPARRAATRPAAGEAAGPAASAGAAGPEEPAAS